MSIIERTLYKDFKPPVRMNAAYELKMTKTGRLPFAAVKDHQRRALLQAQQYLLVRIPDGVGGIGAQLPFDFMSLQGAAGYVVVHFYKKGARHKLLYYININTFLKAEKEYKHKSITEPEAAQLSDVIAPLCG